MRKVCKWIEFILIAKNAGSMSYKLYVNSPEHQVNFLGIAIYSINEFYMKLNRTNVCNIKFKLNDLLAMHEHNICDKKMSCQK